MLLNPYIAGNPLKDSAAFFGRDDIVREVMQMLNHPDEKAIVLFGQRRIGKTTILLQIDQKLTQEGNFTPVYFDLQDRASSTLPEVLHKLAQSVAHRIRMPLPSAEKFDEDGNYFIEEFLPEAIKLAAPNGIVILFDEFDVMDSAQNNHAGRVFFPYLRAFISELVHVKFVFVIGRRPEELSTESLSTFKGIRASRVSLLDRKSTEAVIRQSETKSNLYWTDEAVEQVWKHTQGHTYFTQLLCNVIWERVEENSKNKKSPTVLPKDVDDSVPEAFKQGANAFHWIWDGLPPAERVVMAAMAEVGDDTISQDQIEDVLNQSGVRLVARELKIAPMTLVEWDLLHPIEKNYRFAVPLLQQWVKKNRPLARVKEELDRLDPLAENLYKSGQSFYGVGKPTEAMQLLRQALTANPNHLKSRLLLGRILLEQGQVDTIHEAVLILEDGYKYDTVAVGADLVKTLLAFADFQSDEEEKIKIYSRILEIQPNQSFAREKINSIWISRGEAALQSKNFADAIAAFEKAGDLRKIELVRLAEKERWLNDAELALQQNNLTRALELFRLIGDDAKIAYVTGLIEKAWIDEQLRKALSAEKQEAWEQASQIYNSILERQPGNENINSLAKNARNQSNLSRLYTQAIQYLNARHPENAKPLFIEILQTQPEYKDAARYLYEIVNGRYSHTPKTNNSQKFVSVGGKIVVIILAWISIFSCIATIASIGYVLFPDDPNAAGAVTLIGLVIAFLLATGIAIYLSIRLFQQPSKRTSGK